MTSRYAYKIPGLAGFRFGVVRSAAVPSARRHERTPPGRSFLVQYVCLGGVMQPMILSGSLTDHHGTEHFTWSIADSERPGWNGRYQVTADIRGERVSGTDFTGLEPDSTTTALPLNGAGEISNCELTVRIPMKTLGLTVHEDHLHLIFHLGSGRGEPMVDAILSLGETVVTHSQEDRLEGILGALVRRLDGLTWECCLTCGLSDYNPGGNGNMGMRCHRDARSEYLAARGKWEYWGVPVTEEVPEFYRCDLWEPRQPGAGYRADRRRHAMIRRSAAEPDDPGTAFPAHSCVQSCNYSVTPSRMTTGATQRDRWRHPMMRGKKHG
jgi:hypothetical protein